MAVAVSGGLDSTALLHVVCRQAHALNTSHASQLHVWALHVHHGLQAAADAWVAHLHKQLAGWARRGLPVSLAVSRIQSQPTKGESVEAWARRERYAALAEMARAHACEMVMLAQHRRDQAETLLLQALRGGGMQALAAMRAHHEADGHVWCRPWLDQPHSAIQAYARRWHLSHVQDPSNRHGRFARNRLRLQVWPQLLAAFPDAESALASSARRLAHEASALMQLSAPLLASMTDGQALSIESWAQQAKAVRIILLRLWLSSRGVRPVPQSLVERVAEEALAAHVGQWPLPAVQGSLRLYRGRMRIDRVAVVVQSSATAAPAAAHALPSVDLSRPGRYVLEAFGGSIEVLQVLAQGIDPRSLKHATCKPRSGGEQFQAEQGRPPRALKKQYQAAGIGAEARHGPVVWVGLQLVFVPGLGFDARWLASHGKSPGVMLVWQPDQPKLPSG